MPSAYCLEPIASFVMYTEFFGLSEKPFSITPDPRYLYLSERHAEALAHLLYGVTESGGFIQLTGEVGTGKTTLVRSLLEQLPTNAHVALVLNPRLSSTEFLEAICEELSIKVNKIRGSVKGLVDALNKCLLEAHSKSERIVLIVDEAQNLSADVLEQIRLLTNLETAKQKLLQIILIAQPELREVLARRELRQLAQRITGRYHLEPLTMAETAAYVKHRLSVAGATQDVFSAHALRLIHKMSDGVPRLINVISDRALLGAYTREQHNVDKKLARGAAREVFGTGATLRKRPWLVAGTVTAMLAFAAVAVNRFVLSPRASPAMAVASPADASPRNEPDAIPATGSLLAAEPEPAPAVVAVANPKGKDPEPPDVAQLLERHIATTGTDKAFATLFDIWQVRLPGDDRRPCDQAPDVGLRCVLQRGSWAQVRTLDRPAILSLIDDTGGRYQLVLVGLDDDSATLRFSDSEYSVAMSDLSQYWFGDYLILWHPQAGSGRVLKVGMSGSSVLWLRSRIGEMTGQPLAADRDLYDDELANAVREFQRAKRLQVDGIAGVQTQILINNELDMPSIPRLAGRGG